MIENTEAQEPACEHLWGSHHAPGHRLYWVRQCTICHTVDWDDLDTEIGKLLNPRPSAESAQVARKGPDFEHRVSLLGKRVRVTLNRALNEDPVVAEGILLGFGDEGTAELQQDDGFLHYCWPALDIDSASEAAAGSSR